MNVLASLLIGLIVSSALYVRMPVTGGEDREQRIGAALVAGAAAAGLTELILRGAIA